MFKFGDTHPVTKGDKSFISRNKELNTLFNRIFEAIDKENEKVNYSITGINRIGKTSIVKELCRRFDEFSHPNTFVLFTSLEGVKSFWPFWSGKVVMPLIKMLDMEEVKNIDEDYFDQIVDIQSYFEDRGVLSRLYAENCDIVEHEEAKEKMEVLLSLLGYCEKKVLLIIDEFDFAARAFGKNDAFFDWFRGLLQDENHPLSAVTISRRSIYYIETNAFGGSTLSGTFKPFWVFGYTNSELEQYFSLLEENGCPLTAEQKGEIIYYCGRSPYYLAIMGNAIIESKLGKGALNIGRLFKQERRYYASFGHIVDILKKEKLYETMLQLFVGPQYNLDQEKITELIGNGYCMDRKDLWAETLGGEYHDCYHTYEEEYSYLTICNSFIDYLAMQKEQDAENIFPELMEAEKRLRSVIRKRMTEVYSSEWKNEIEKLLHKLLDGKQLAGLENNYKHYLAQRNNSDNPDALDDSILCAASIRNLGSLILNDWDGFKEYFAPTDKEDFNEMISVMQWVRNPLAHSNEGVVPSNKLSEAQQYSKDICNALEGI